MRQYRYIAILAAAALLALGARVQSQNAAVPKTTIQQLEEMQAANQLTLDKQTATLQKLDELFKEAQQTRFMVRRG